MKANCQKVREGHTENIDDIDLEDTEETLVLSKILRLTDGNP